MTWKIAINGKFQDQKITDVTKWARNPKNSILRTFSNIVFCVFIFLGLLQAH